MKAGILIRSLLLSSTLHPSSSFFNLGPALPLGAVSNADARARLSLLQNDLSLAEVGFTRVEPVFLLQMQQGERGERFPSGYRGGQQRRGRGGLRRRGGRGGFSGGGDNFEGRSSGVDGGGAMSTDYVRGGMPDATALLDERLDSFLQVYLSAVLVSELLQSLR